MSGGVATAAFTIAASAWANNRVVYREVMRAVFYPFKRARRK
jgi:hypothetical protein